MSSFSKKCIEAVTITTLAVTAVGAENVESLENLQTVLQERGLMAQKIKSAVFLAPSGAEFFDYTWGRLYAFTKSNNALAVTTQDGNVVVVTIGNPGVEDIEQFYSYEDEEGERYTNSFYSYRNVETPDAQEWKIPNRQILPEALQGYYIKGAVNALEDDDANATAEQIKNLLEEDILQESYALVYTRQGNSDIQEEATNHQAPRQEQPFFL